MVRAVALLVLLACCGVSFCQRRTSVTFPDTINIKSVSLREVDAVLRDRVAVENLVRCFENQARCTTRGELRFVHQVRQLGRKGRCFRCTPREQQHIQLLMRRSVAGLQRNYPAQWARLAKHLQHLF